MGADDNDVEDTEKPGVSEGFGARALFRCITSCAVYSCQSLATPQNSGSKPQKGPTVTKGASCLVVGSGYGVA